jgi:hypothetical protein
MQVLCLVVTQPSSRLSLAQLLCLGISIFRVAEKPGAKNSHAHNLCIVIVFVPPQLNRIIAANIETPTTLLYRLNHVLRYHDD